MMEFRVRSLGVAAETTSLASAACTGSVLHVGTRSTAPTRVCSLDLTSRTVTSERRLDVGDGVRVLTAQGEHLYAGTYESAALYRLPADGTAVDLVHAFDEDTFVWSLAPTADDGRVYAGTYPTGSVVEYDPKTDSVRRFDRVSSGRDYVRSLAVVDDTIYAGGGTNAALTALDRDEGTARSVLPAAFTDESMVYDLAAVGTTVAARTTPSDRVFLFDHADPADYRPLPLDGVTALGSAHDRFLLLADRTLYQYTPHTDELELVSDVSGDALVLHEADDTVIGTSTNGEVWTVDRQSGETTTISLDAAGMRPGAEELQCIHAVDGTVIVTSHSGLSIFDGDWRHLDVDGEGKAMADANGTVYVATYPGAHLLTVEPASDDVTRVATIGAMQNRPRAVVYDPARQLVHVGTRPNYGHLGGAVATYDPATGDLTVQRNVVQDQSISAIAAHDDATYLGSEIPGGLGIDPVADEARVVQWKPIDRTRDWAVTPIAGTTAVADLVCHDGHLLGVTDDGEFFLLDRDDGTRLASWPGTGQWTALTTSRGSVYGVTEDELVRVDPAERAVSTVASVLDANWYGNPHLSAHANALYTLSGYDVIQATPAQE